MGARDRVRRAGVATAGHRPVLPQREQRVAAHHLRAGAARPRLPAGAARRAGRTRRSSTSASCARCRRCATGPRPTSCWSATTPTSPRTCSPSADGTRRLGVVGFREFTSTQLVDRRTVVLRPRVRRPRVQQRAAADADHPARRVRPDRLPALTRDRKARCATTTCSPRWAAPRWSGCRGSRRAPGRAAVGQARGPQPHRLDQGPPRAGDDRGGGEGRPAAPRLHDPRADVGQHRHLAGHGRQAQGLPDRVRDAGEHLRGAAPAAADVGRRDRVVAGRRRLQRGGAHGQAGGRGAPRLGDALPVRQPRERTLATSAAPAPSCSPTCRRSPTSWPGSAPPAP